MLLLALLAQSVTTLTLDFTKPGLPVSPNLYGLMTEEINYSYEGGLYGELIRNRTFKDNREQPAHWTAVGSDSSIKLEPTGGVSEALPVSLRVLGGVANDGFWGIPVRPSTTYRFSVWAKSDAAKTLNVSLETADGTKVFAKTSISGVNGTWKKFNSTLVSESGFAATKDAKVVIRTGTLQPTWLSSVSLFPPTHNDRPNGNRPDLMKLLSDMKPRFLRFPGGNYLEGNTFKDRFNWKKTLGPLEDRPGHMAPWGYRSTDGMGMLEFLHWCEDMGAKPVLGIFAGYVLNGDYVGAGTELNGFVQDGLDQIEYVIGGPKTKWGSQRVKDGHPEPFPLEYVEIGNEDGFDLSGSYEARFVQFYDAIKKKYPKIKVISSTGGKDWLGSRFPITQRTPDLVDEHYYASTWEMMAMASKYDSYDRKGPKVFVGEWAAQDVPEPWKDAGKKGPTPNMNCAISDAAFMTGLERNSDIIQMACYAPLLVNVNPGARQWAVNLIGYDGLTSFGSPSYYAQKIFMENIGDRTVPVTLAGSPTQTQKDQTIPTIFASATRDSKSGQVFVKIVNSAGLAQEFAFDFKGASVASEGTLVSINGSPADMNSITEPKKIFPVSVPLSGIGATFRRVLPPHSVSVFTFKSEK